MTSDNDVQTSIKRIMSKIIENLGLDVDETQYEISESRMFFMSITHFACVKFTNKANGRDEEIAMVIKRPPESEFRQICHCDSQFHNEILFYRMYVKPGENFPRLLYTHEQSADLMIALENVTNRGYHPCSYKYDAPLEYTLAAMREIGRLHGKGYIMKELEREKFFNIIKNVQEPRYNDSIRFKVIVNDNATRAVEYLRRHGHDAAFCDKMEALLSNGYNKIMLKVIEPLEPLSTICHGDFTLSNTLFKAEANGQYRAILIDFALIRYGTPVIDLSTYFCLSCPKETRKDVFFNIMRVYHDALKEYLLENGIQDIEKYSYDALLDDYRRGALFGFLLASFFLPTLMGYISSDNILDDQIRGPEFSAKKLREAGGDPISKILAEMLLHLANIGCV